MESTGPRNRKAKNSTASATASPGAILQIASVRFEEGDYGSAADAARIALKTTGEGGNYELLALNLLGMIAVEMGEVDAAREYITRAIALDEDGTRDERIGGGPEKFLVLAQLSEEGGSDSVVWYEKGAAVLRKQIRALSESLDGSLAEVAEHELVHKKHKLAGVLCAVAEVYMTDLSWEADAEARCEALITEAAMMAPDLSETWQTVANVRISQGRGSEARTALERGLDLWRHLGPDDPRIPDFATRVGLARLLLEIGMGVEALEVLERLVEDDDESVEVWYLGGWGLFLEGQNAQDEQQAAEQGKGKKRTDDEEARGGQGWRVSWTSARQWLSQCMKLYQTQEYEDERLGEHARELLAQVYAVIGGEPDGEAGDDWEDTSGNEDDDDVDMKD